MSFEEVFFMILGLSVLFLVIWAAAWLVLCLVKIFRVICNCLIINKAGEDFWKGLIPFYNMYVLFDLAFNHKTAVVMFIIYVFSTVITFGLSVTDRIIGLFAEQYSDIQTIYNTLALITVAIGLLNLLIFLLVTAVKRFYSFAIARAFGHETGFCVAAIFFPTITSAILAFGSNEYVSDVTELIKEDY